MHLKARVAHAFDTFVGDGEATQRLDAPPPLDEVVDVHVEPVVAVEEEACLVGFVAAVTAFGVLALLFDTLRSPILRLIVALVFVAPAAVAGYALVHGVTKEAVPSEIWRTIFCMIGGAFVGVSALARLAAPLDHTQP